MLRLTGAVLTTVSAVLFLLVFAADLFGLHANPYLGVVFFLVLILIFVIFKITCKGTFNFCVVLKC